MSTKCTFVAPINANSARTAETTCDASATIRNIKTIPRTRFAIQRMFRVSARPASTMVSAFAGRTMKMSTQISASMVKELREKSGAPMMDCKKALSAEGVNGDLKLAMDWLRAKGIARAASNADRVTMEGVIAVNRNTSGVVTVVEVNSETGTSTPSHQLKSRPHELICMNLSIITQTS